MDIFVSDKLWMLNMKLKNVSLFVLIIILFSFFSGCFESSEEEGEVHEFIFTDLDGVERQLLDYRGKVVLLDLWATWCGPCQFQMTELKKVYENYSRNDLEIISVDIDSRESVELIQSFRDWFKEEVGIELNWIFGTDDGSISEKYMKEGAIPTLCIFDQKGRLAFNHTGICVYKEMPLGLPEDTPVLASIIDGLID